MLRRTYWQLTVSYWPEAIKAGLTPVNAARAPTAFPEGEQYYRAFEFEFDNPPTREDFHAVVQRLPWARTCFGESSHGHRALLEVVDANQWPFIDFAHKGSTVDLYDGECHVGELKVWKQESWQNEAYLCPMIVVENEHAALRGVKEDKMSSANLCLLQNENRVREKMIEAKNPTSEQIVFWMQEILFEKGFRTTKPKLKVLVKV